MSTPFIQGLTSQQSTMPGLSWFDQMRGIQNQMNSNGPSFIGYGNDFSKAASANAYQANPAVDMSGAVGATNVGAVSAATDFKWGDLFSGENFKNVGGALTGAANIGNAWVNWQNMEEAKKMFAFNTDLTNRNLENQAKTLNATMRSRQISRNAFHGGENNPNNPHASTEDYMAQNGLSEKKIKTRG